MLHVLLHMARHKAPFTSEQIAKMLKTNPAVVRRTMAGLRRAGYVSSAKGHGGGWTIAREPQSITLLDVHQAVGGPRLFAIGHERRETECAVEQAVNKALEVALNEAEAILMQRLQSVTLFDLLADFDAACTNSGWGTDGIERHGDESMTGTAHVTPVGGNIFLDLGFPPDEADRLKEASNRRIAGKPR